jgi:hypothetical protein
MASLAPAAGKELWLTGLNCRCAELDTICSGVTDHLLRSEFADPPSWQATIEVVKPGRALQVLNTAAAVSVSAGAV